MIAQPNVALDRVLRVLLPLVRLLLRNGVTYTVFVSAIKRVFLQAAQQELATRNMKATDSAISLLSGVHRRDVRNLMRGELVDGHAEPVGLGLAAQVVGRWMNEPEFSAGVNGGHKLPRSGETGSFDALVAGVSSDVRPRAVLDELLRLGVVTETEEGITLAQSGLVPNRGFEEKSWLLAQNLQDHANAAVANLQDNCNFLEQAVFVDEISPESADHLRQAALRAWSAAFKTVMSEAQNRFKHDAAHLVSEQRKHRARFGVFFYSERQD